MQVLNFLDDYTKLCESNSLKKSVIITNMLQEALDYGTEPEELDFSGNTPDFRENRIDDNYLKNALIKPLVNAQFIRVLKLNFNEIGDEGALAIAEYLKNDRYLKELDLSSNNINENGAVSISEALTFNETLESLILKGNKIGDKGGMAIASTLQVNQALFDLNIASCDLGATSLIGLFTVLQSNLNIEQLDISDNRSRFTYLTQSVLSNLMTHLSNMLKCNRTLVKLNISKMGITDWIIVDHLADAIQTNQTLLELDLSCNRIRQDGAIAIANALNVNSCLKDLKLTKCTIQEQGAKSFMEMLSQNKTLKSLHLDHNDISGRGLCYLASGIENNVSLVNINVWGNHFDQESSKRFAQLTGGLAKSVKIATTEDKLSESDLKILRKLTVSKRFVKVSDVFADKTEKPRSRLAQENVDVCLYEIDGTPVAARLNKTLV